MHVFGGAVKNLKLKAWCAIQECQYIFVANRGLLDIETHLETATQVKIVRGKSTLFKITNFFMQPHSKGGVVHAAEGNLAVHCAKQHYCYISTD